MTFWPWMIETLDLQTPTKECQSHTERPWRPRRGRIPLARR
jgi:hypothetical protein